MTEPWGHKVHIHIYLPGSLKKALDVSDFFASLNPPAGVRFVGTSIDVVQDEPTGMGDGLLAAHDVAECQSSPVSPRSPFGV